MNFKSQWWVNYANGKEGWSENNLENSCHKLIQHSSPCKSACKNKTIQYKIPHIQFILPHSTPTHCIHIVDVDISETKWSASVGRHYGPASPHLSLLSSSTLSPRHILEHSTRHAQPGFTRCLSDSRTKVSIYNPSLIRPRPPTPSEILRVGNLSGEKCTWLIINQ